MTANVSLVIAEKKGVLRVPNAALRFNPDTAAKSSAQGSGGATEPGARIWILENGVPRPLAVQVGLSDGRWTEVVGPGVAEGLAILVGVETVKTTQTKSASPISTTVGAPAPPPG